MLFHIQEQAFKVVGLCFRLIKKDETLQEKCNYVINGVLWEKDVSNYEI